MQLQGISLARGPASFTPLKVTTNGEAFIGATTFSIEQACRVGVATQYLITGGASGFENFSSTDANVVTLDQFADCATFPWKYEEGEGIRFDSGLAIVSDGNPEADLDFVAFNSDASLVIDEFTMDDYDGSHWARLIISDDIPDQAVGGGRGELSGLCHQRTPGSNLDPGPGAGRIARHYAAGQNGNRGNSFSNERAPGLWEEFRDDPRLIQGSHQRRYGDSRASPMCVSLG